MTNILEHNKIKLHLKKVNESNCYLAVTEKDNKKYKRGEKNMAIVEVNENNFKEEVLNAKLPVLVDFNANWCGPCQMLKPIIDDVSGQREDYKFVSINIDNNISLAEQYGILSIPCLIIIKDGKEMKRNVGMIQKDMLEEFLGDK